MPNLDDLEEKAICHSLEGFSFVKDPLNAINDPVSIYRDNEEEDDDEEARGGVDDEHSQELGSNRRSSEEVNEAIRIARHPVIPAVESSRHGMQVCIYPSREALHFCVSNIIAAAST